MSTAATSSRTGQCEASRLSDPAKKKARASPDRPGAPARPSPAAVLQADRMNHAAPMRSDATSHAGSKPASAGLAAGGGGKKSPGSPIKIGRASGGERVWQ